MEVVDYEPCGYWHTHDYDQPRKHDISHDENSKYPVQSLYYLCLNCLRKNYHLINFTVLSRDICVDMATIMRYRNHLKKFRMVPCRNIKFYRFESYIYKHYPEKAYVVTNKQYLENYITNKEFYEYIPGVLIINHTSLIYEPRDQKVYDVDIETFNYIGKICISALKHLYSGGNFRSNSKGYTKLHSEEFFDKYPGLAEWAESLGFISQKLWIPENLID